MIVIARGDDIRHFTIRPWVAALCGAVLFAVAAGYLLATGYLILRDDLINSAVMRQAKVQHAYEDRISSLRAQVDRITSHRLLDQQFMENKITELANRQSALAERSGALLPLVERARQTGVNGTVPASELPIPALRPGAERASLDNPLLRTASAADFGALGFAREPEPSTDANLAPDPLVTASINDQAIRRPAGSNILTLGEVGETLNNIEIAQIEQIHSLTQAAHTKRNDLIQAATASGLSLRSTPVEASATGGPFVPLEAAKVGEAFQSSVDSLEQALDALDQTRGEVKSFPIAHPAPGRKITSGFGKRRDPILGRSAFHAGIDFRTPIGTPILAPADGEVTRAGRAGGYGKMVEVRHGNGLSTRFAHLSRIHVKVGQKVTAGQAIGAAGNTGRSTGPHLHYEIRANGEAVNPMRYLKAGSRVGQHL